MSRVCHIAGTDRLQHPCGRNRPDPRDRRGEPVHHRTPGRRITFPGLRRRRAAATGQGDDRRGATHHRRRSTFAAPRQSSWASHSTPRPSSVRRQTWPSWATTVFGSSRGLPICWSLAVRFAGRSTAFTSFWRSTAAAGGTARTLAASPSSTSGPSRRLTTRRFPPSPWREPFWWGMFDGDFAARSKVNGNRPDLKEKHGGKIRFGGGLFVHTFYPSCHPRSSLPNTRNTTAN